MSGRQMMVQAVLPSKFGLHKSEKKSHTQMHYIYNKFRFPNRKESSSPSIFKIGNMSAIGNSKYKSHEIYSSCNYSLSMMIIIDEIENLKVEVHTINALSICSVFLMKILISKRTKAKNVLKTYFTENLL